MRELALWDGDGLERSFGDVDELAATAGSTTARTPASPAARSRRRSPTVASIADRIASWRKLEREAAHHERRVDALARAEERRKWKPIGKSVERHMDAKYGSEGWR